MLIKDVFADFLTEQEAMLSPKTYREYKSVIGLFKSSLDGYAWNYLDNGSKAYDEAHKKNLTFIDVYEHNHIWGSVGEFLNYFIPRKVNCGNEFMLKTCPRVTRKLLKWMRDKNLLNQTDEEINRWCKNQTWEDSLKEMGCFNESMENR